MFQNKQSQAFLAVAETGSFELAAEKLSITASAVTLRVQTLEKTLGQVLIIRERPCRVTQVGHEVLQYLQHARLMEQNLVQHLIGKSSDSTFYKIKIATNADSLATWLLSAIQDTLIREQIVIELKLDDQTQTHHLLEAGLVNACISTEIQPMKGCVAQTLGTMTYRMVATPAFCQQYFSQGINRNTLRQAPSVIFNDKDQVHTNILIRLFGLTPSMYPSHYIPSSHTFCEAILSNLGFGMLPDLQIENRLETGELIEIIPEAKTDILLYWHHWKQQSAQLEQLTQHILKQAKLLIH